MSTYFVCPAPPCSNGQLHLGHLGGVYLLADIYARHLRGRGHVVHYVTGADEHGSYTLVKALSLGRPVQEVSETYCRQIERCLEVADIQCDQFIRTSSQEHQAVALKVYAQLVRSGAVVSEQGAQLYCERCNEFVADSLAMGQCHECGSNTDSSLCEECGEPIQHRRLEGAKHRTCGSVVAARPIIQAHLQLNVLAPALARAIEQSPWPAGLKARELGWLAGRLRNLPMTRRFDRGVIVREPAEVSGQSLMTWFEGLWCFLTGVQRTAPAGQADVGRHLRESEAKVVFFMGQDNRFYYTVGVSAVMQALGAPIPHNMSIQSFYLLDGQKFSTSRNHAVWTDDAVTEFGADAVRFYLASIAAPFPNATNNVTREDMVKDAQWLQAVKKQLLNRERMGAAVVRDEGAVRALSDYGAAVTGLRFWDAVRIVRELGERVTTDARLSSHLVAAWLTMLRDVAPRMASECGRHLFGASWGEWGLDWDALINGAVRPAVATEAPRRATAPANAPIMVEA